MADDTTTTTDDKKPPVLDLSTVIKIGGEEIPLSELIAARQQATELSEYKTHVDRFLQADGEKLTAETEKSARKVLSMAGYEPEAVEQYIQYLGESGQETTQTTETTEDQTVTVDTNKPAELGGVEERMKRLEAELEASEERRRSDRLTSMERRLDEVTQKALDSKTDLGVLLGRFDELHGLDGEKAEEARSRRRDIVGQEFRKELVDHLKRRKAAEGGFNQNWWDEEAGKAAEVVAERHRAVIGDPDRLRRVPETVIGEDQLIRRKPPEDPKFEETDDSASAVEKARKFTEDSLKHLVHQAEQGGDTQV